MLKSALLVLSGNAFSSVLLLLRNLLVARLISVEDYGIAATFALSMAVVEMATTIGLHQLIVQDDNGDDPDLQAGLQGFHLLRGIFSGVVLVLLAHPIALFLGIPDVAWAYQVMALVPVMRGFIHFDVYRFHREMKFLPLLSSTAVPALLSVLLIWPFYQLFGGYQVMLYAYLVQWGGMSVASHLVAQRPYRLVLDRDIMVRALRFGWPLLINNMLLLAVFQGEKLIVGREMGMTSLAILAMGFTLTLTPVLVASRSLQTFFLPQLSASKNDREQFGYLAMVTLQVGTVGGLVLVLAVVFWGPPLVTFMFGEKYAALNPLLVWLSILQALRLLKAGCAIVALSQGHTLDTMIGNVFRTLSMPLSWFVASSGGSLLTIIWIGIAAEMIAYLVMTGRVVYRAKLGLQPIILLVGGATTFLVGAIITAEMAGPNTAVSAGFVGLLFLNIVAMGALRRYVLERKLVRFEGR
jgi:O-antigen/teichoic acid export membrane protein